MQAHFEIQDNYLALKKSNQLQIDTTLTVLEVFILNYRRLLSRLNRFSMLLLTDAVRPLSTHVVEFMFSLLVKIIRGNFSSKVKTCRIPLNDHQINHACDWLEAIADSHFVEISLQWKNRDTSRLAFKSLLDCIDSIDTSSEFLEVSCGIWSHINRNTGLTSKPWSNHLHSVEKITF